MDILSYVIGKKAGGGGASGTITITENGSHNVSSYATALVNVSNSYDAGDEGKVVSSGALVAQTSQTYTANGTYDTTVISEIVVALASAEGVSF